MLNVLLEFKSFYFNVALKLRCIVSNFSSQLKPSTLSGLVAKRIADIVNRHQEKWLTSKKSTCKKVNHFTRTKMG